MSAVFIRIVVLALVLIHPFSGAASASEFPEKFNPGHYLLVPLNSHLKCHDDTLWDCPFKDVINNPNFRGAQVRYTWRELEPNYNKYNFDSIIKDLKYLESHGKRLIIQIQDVSFKNSEIPVPDYIVSQNGVINRSKGGHIAKRWDWYVHYRFQQLIAVLGKTFDHETSFEAINLPETSVGFTNTECNDVNIGFSHDNYLATLKKTQLTLVKYFPSTIKMHYMTYYGCAGGWPYISELLDHASSIGIGYGGPDTVFYSEYLNDNVFPKIIDAKGHLPRGLAVQYNNYYETHPDSSPITIEELLKFGMENLELDYMFWLRHKPKLNALNANLNNYVSPPSIIPGEGLYNDTVDARIKSKIPEAVIYYTVNGDTPSANSNQYFESNTISLSDRTLLKAVALKGSEQSPIAMTDFKFGENIINNGDFESADANWQKIDCPKKCVINEPATSNKKLHLSGNGQWLVVRQYVPVKPNQNYEITGSLQTSAITKTARFSYRWLNDNVALISNKAFGKTSGTTAMTEHTSGPITSPSEATHLEINLRVNQGYGDAYFDNIKVVELD